MFDISISEMMVILVVALIVIGPERLPKVARTMGHLWGRARGYVNTVKADIDRDMAMDEYRQFTERVKREAGDAKAALLSEVDTAEQAVEQLNQYIATPSETAVTEVPAATSVPVAPQSVADR